ncbi:MAG: competence/damage-inducible protein A [Deltaproteobacteria bacterium]|nr:competence/damage-inducible protein A [Deltaproteobacteria bacterium]
MGKHGELIIVGDEVLDGRVLNENAHFFSSCLSAIGLGLSCITTVGDDPAYLEKVLGRAVERSAFVLVTGGLGPTEDDRTTAVAAQAFNRPLSVRPDLLAHIRSVCQAAGQEAGPLEKLAWLPQGAKPLNPKGRYCGFSLKQGQSLIFFLPGVPAEARELFDEVVASNLLKALTAAPLLLRRTIKMVGLAESEAAGRLEETLAAFPEIIFGSYPNFPEVHLSLTVSGTKQDRLEETLNRAEAEIMARVGQFVFGRDEETLAGIVGRLLKRQGLTLAVAESCTGGMLAQSITALPGASDYFIEGVVSYANQAKVDLLGVDPELIETHGAVSAQVAQAMAEGLRERSRVGLALSTTGIAGPTGGTAAKPVGLVYFGLAGGGPTQVAKRRFSGSRGQIQAQAAAASLELLRRRLILGQER